MSLTGYFERPGQNRMPKGPDSCGIRWEGPVLSGAMSVQLRQEREKAVYSRPPEFNWMASRKTLDR